jgi:hypothetical protein
MNNMTLVMDQLGDPSQLLDDGPDTFFHCEKCQVMFPKRYSRCPECGETATEENPE